MNDSEIITGIIAVGIPKIVAKLAGERSLPPIEVDPTGTGIHVSRVKITIGIADIREPSDLARVGRRVIAAFDGLDESKRLNDADIAVAREALARVMRRGFVSSGSDIYFARVMRAAELLNGGAT